MGKEIKLNEKIWEEFGEKKAVINCRTEEEVENLMRILEGKGQDKRSTYRMASGWRCYKDKTCYEFLYSSYKSIDIGCCSKEYYIRQDYKVYTYKELITPDKNKNIVTNIKHIKNGRATIVEVNGKKGIAKCHEEEIHNQDDVVGLHLALLRAEGITPEELIHRLEKSGVVKCLCNKSKDKEENYEILGGHKIVKQDTYNVGDKVAYMTLSSVFAKSVNVNVGEITKISGSYINTIYYINGQIKDLFTVIAGKIVEENIFKDIPTDELLNELKRRTEKAI